MEIEGKVIQVMPLQSIASQKGPMKKQEFVIEVESKYPRKVCFAIWNDKADLFTSKVGDIIKVYFDLESREYNSRWYTEAKAWKVESVSAKAAGTDSANTGEITDDIPASFSNEKNDMDDLPF
ncbi:MAG: DUF3127 domain-containing protein [Bacteroidetes bacterium]|nr:DUF3127 domain-containing protein [Bacteroidota bacterium]